MDEKEWLACTDEADMLKLLFLQAKDSERKLRLFACACCRASWHVLGDERSRETVQVSELYADGQVSVQELGTARALAREAAQQIANALWNEQEPLGGVEFEARSRAVQAAWDTSQTANTDRIRLQHIFPSDGVLGEATLLRDIFGNPFRHVVVDSSWLAWNGAMILKLAHTIYDDRAFDRLPILADALEEAGCTNVDILAHCRQPGEHVRGCWVVDLLLGKA